MKFQVHSMQTCDLKVDKHQDQRRNKIKEDEAQETFVPQFTESKRPEFLRDQSFTLVGRR